MIGVSVCFSLFRAFHTCHFHPRTLICSVFRTVWQSQRLKSEEVRIELDHILNQPSTATAQKISKIGEYCNTQLEINAHCNTELEAELETATTACLDMVDALESLQTTIDQTSLQKKILANSLQLISNMKDDKDFDLIHDGATEKIMELAEIIWHYYTNASLKGRTDGDHSQFQEISAIIKGLMRHKYAPLTNEELTR